MYAALRSLGAGANDVYKAMGRPGLSVRFSLLRLVVLVPVLLFATRWGIAGVAWAQAAGRRRSSSCSCRASPCGCWACGRWSCWPRSPRAGGGLATAAAALAVVLLLPGPDAVVLVWRSSPAGSPPLGALRLAAPSFLPDLLRLVRRKAPAR